MKTLRSRILPLSLALLLPLAVSAHDAAAPAESVTSPVTVELGDFNTMRELKHLHGKQRTDTEGAIKTLASWLSKRAVLRIGSGQTLKVTLIDVDLAGDYEPSAGIDMDHVRVVREMYPPRIELSWRLSDASGASVDEGQTTLTDMSFLSASGPASSRQLAYEMRMLNDWLRERFPKKP
ncbi:MAG TPA: DUF3016 domain-containing protein [Chiayiivirga sp.]|nr:DUF3016 domain-containing protein [Chiayiivirga sp.]